jgi:hypothetical protein
MHVDPALPGNRITRRQAFRAMLGATAAAVTMPCASAIAAGRATSRQSQSVVLNPYQDVDWCTCGRHKAALHVHTLQSDGYHPVVEVVEAYRRAGFEILSLTDHDWNYPNARITWKHLPPEKASPYPKGPHRPNFPADPTWPWTDYGCADPGKLRMVGIEGNELTFRHHINSYFSDYGVWYTRTGKCAPYGGIVDAYGKEVWEDDQLWAIRDKGGLAVINHPGIPDKYTWWERKPLPWYVERYQKHSADYLIGLEMANNSPPQYAYDEGLWDQLLARFMPRRPIWGFGNDDMHQMEDVRQAFTIFFLDRLDTAAVRQAMQSGRFCICTSTKRTNYGQQSPQLSLFPKLVAVEVDESSGTIHLQVADCDQVRWISAPESLEPIADYKTSDRPWPLGRVVHVGPTLHYRQVAGIRNYVRAELCRTEGQDTHRTLTNPFGIGVRETR